MPKSIEQPGTDNQGNTDNLSGFQELGRMDVPTLMQVVKDCSPLVEILAIARLEEIRRTLGSEEFFTTSHNSD